MGEGQIGGDMMGEACEQPRLREAKPSRSLKIFASSASNIWEKYEEIKEIGRGAFAVCSLCRHKETGESYAVKKMSKGRLMSESSKDGVVLEVKIQRCVGGHENIVNVLDTYEDAEFVYIVLELCQGGDMFDRLIAKGRYSEKDSADLLRAMLTAISHCHERGVLHRDLKPDNFLFDSTSEDATLKTADFGLSCFHEHGATETQACGTPTYIAPEVIRERYDEKADIWSIGVILYIMLSGKMPFYGRTDAICLKSTLRGQYTFTHPNWRTVSNEAKEVVRLMLTYDPAKRPGAEELLKNPWVRGAASTAPLVDSVIQNMKQFHKMNKLKKRAVQIMAENSQAANLEMVRKMFEEVDKDNSGTITVDEMKDAMRQSNKVFSDEYFEQLWETYDVDGDGVINYIEFLTATSQLNKLMTAENIKKAFRAIDKDGNGRITVAEITEALTGYNCDSEMVTQIVRDADKNNDGEIDYQEFVEMMKTREDLKNAGAELRGILVHQEFLE